MNIGKINKDNKNIAPLDLRTNLLLTYLKANKVSHPDIVVEDKKRTMYPKDCDPKDVYVFNSFEEYKNFYLMYLDNIEDETIELPIVVRGGKGQIVAHKNFMNHLILERKVFDFYSKYSLEKIQEVHDRGNITPIEVFLYWNENNICVPANNWHIVEKSRCDFFCNNCSDCLREISTHHDEYVPSEEYKKKILKKYLDYTKD